MLICFLVGFVASRSLREDRDPARAALRLAPGARLLEGGPDHWRSRGFFEVVPPIPLPVGRVGGDWTRIFVRFPSTPNEVEGSKAQLTVVADPRTGAPRLKAPVGTTADRVEYRRTAEGTMIADVRGTEIRSDGEIFRAFRPAAATPGSPLFGYTWLRAPGPAPALVRAGFRAALLAGHGFVRPVEDRAAAALRLDRLLDCAGCHEPFRPERTSARFLGPRRGTDATGFHVLEYALLDEAPLESYRALDPSTSDPFIERRCAFGPVLGSEGTTALRCEDGSVPRLRYVLAEALRAGDARARAVCATRARLEAHMDEAARRAFADSLSACRLPETGRAADRGPRPRAASKSP